MTSDLFTTPIISTGPWIAPNIGQPSGAAETVGPAESALFDGSDDTYIRLYSGTPSGSGTYIWLDGLYVTLLADITELQIRLSYTNPIPEAFNDAGRDITGWTGAGGPRVINTVLHGPGGDIQDLTFTFDPPLLAGQTLLFLPQDRAGDLDVKFPTTIYQIGPVTAPVPTDAPVPWLRVYPRHDQRLYPPTRSLGARPAGYP